MKATIALREQPVLGDAKPGEPIFLNLWTMRHCVCAVAKSVEASATIPVSVIGCSVDRGEASYMAPGTQLNFEASVEITFLEQVERCAYRERTNSQQVATNPEVALDAIRPVFGGQPLLLPKRMHFSAEINLDGRTLDTERVLDGFRRLIDDCLSDLKPEFVGTVGLTAHQIEAWKNKGFGCPHFPDDTKNSCSLCYVKRSSTGAQAPPDTP